MLRKLFLLFLLVMLLPRPGSASEPTNRIRFPLAGFTIAPLDSPPGKATQQALMMFMPVTDNFAPNVNVQIQPYGGSIEEYVSLTLEQFKSAKVKLLQQTAPSKSAVVFEYSGEIQGRQLHWYARAEKSRDSVYLVTATAAAAQWTTAAARLKSCVDSFRCEDGEQSSEPKAAPPRRL